MYVLQCGLSTAAYMPITQSGTLCTVPYTDSSVHHSELCASHV